MKIPLQLFLLTSDGQDASLAFSGINHLPAPAATLALTAPAPHFQSKMCPPPPYLCMT